MKQIALLLLTVSTSLFSLTVSSEDAKEIADKIWKNECGGTLAGLTHWGKGEGFGSFGIGHFIWYADGKKERFEETFPELIAFLQKHKAAVPLWLQKCPRCPWSTREAFYKDIDSPNMVALRQMLMATRGLQASFMIERFEKALTKLEQKEEIIEKISLLTSSKKGVYALIDYLNFKGSGLSPEEAYEGKGWGLLQVLSSMSSSGDPLVQFVSSAKETLSLRVKNAPPERGEERWLSGWHNRLESYLD